LRPQGVASLFLGFPVLVLCFLFNCRFFVLFLFPIFDYHLVLVTPPPRKYSGEVFTFSSGFFFPSVILRHAQFLLPSLFATPPLISSFFKVLPNLLSPFLRGCRSRFFFWTVDRLSDSPLFISVLFPLSFLYLVLPTFPLPVLVRPQKYFPLTWLGEVFFPYPCLLTFPLFKGLVFGFLVTFELTLFLRLPHTFPFPPF